MALAPRGRPCSSSLTAGGWDRSSSATCCQHMGRESQGSLLLPIPGRTDLGCARARSVRPSLALLRPYQQMLSGAESHSVTRDNCRSQSLPGPKTSAEATHKGGEWRQPRGAELPSPAHLPPPRLAPCCKRMCGEEGSHGKWLRERSQEGQEALRGENKASKAGAAPEPLPFPLPPPHR